MGNGAAPKRKWIQSLIIIAILFFCAGFGIRMLTRSPDKGESVEAKPQTTTITEPLIQKEKPNIPEQWYMSGFPETMVVERGTAINLSNDPLNKNIELKYLIMWENDGKKEEYETGPIQCGDPPIAWEAAEYLPVGDNEVTIREIPYYQTADEKVEFPYIDMIVTIRVQ